VKQPIDLRIVFVVIALVTLFWLQIILAVRPQAQTFDEGFHLFAGYRYAQCGDFGINSEHPPLMKLVAGTALRIVHTPPPSTPCGQDSTGKFDGYGLGLKYLYHSGLNADDVLFRARFAVSIFSILLALVCWAFAREMFGTLAGVLALAWLAFEPNLIAHGALITTDIAVSAFLLATVYAMYRYWQEPGTVCLLLAGVFTGLTLAAKHSGVLILPIIVLLCSIEYARKRKNFGQVLAACVAMFVIAYVVLWASYGFRYWPRPGHAPMTPALDQFLQRVREQGTHGVIVDHIIPALARWHLAPLGYLYGFVDVLSISHPGQPPFLWGTLYPHGQWFYFPIAFVIKSTIGFILVLAFGLILAKWKDAETRRNLAYIFVPVAIIVMAGMASGLNIGYRHVMPIIGILCVIAGGAAAQMWSKGTAWRAAMALLLMTHVLSSALTFPNYIPYSNEMFGRSSNTYLYLTDANVDWGQALIQTRDWLKANHIQDCWMAYDGAIDPAFYALPCRRLSGNQWDPQVVPLQAIEGTFLLSPLTVSGIEWEPGDLHPYAEFMNVKPIANVGNAMLVFRGTYDLTRAAAVASIARTNSDADDDPEVGLEDGRRAVALTPTSVRAHLALAQAFERAKQYDSARSEYQAALTQAHKTGDAWYPNEIAAAERGLRQVGSTTLR
jgi:tetratricopeptide (TPR) repeat protein